MAALLPSPELQFVDGNGHPYAGGTLATYVTGTTTPKATWQDEAATVLNANPITLDSAGRCICWGDGVYRVILHDAAGNLVFDQTSDTLVSAAMAPVVAAPTIAEAVRLLGIQDMIDIETQRATAAENALQSQITGGATTAALNAEISRAEAAEAALGARIDQEITDRTNADDALRSGLPGTGDTTSRQGSATTDLAGVAHISFSPPFPNMVGISAYDYDTSLYQPGASWTQSLSGITLPLVLASDGTTAAPSGITFHWMTLGF